MENREKLLNPTLPHELIEGILLRLPVKSLVRFKSACMSWFYLISDSNFAKCHCDLAAKPTHRFLCKSSSGSSKLQSIDIEAPIDDHSSVLSRRRHVLPYPLSRHRFDDSFYDNILIYGSCRGFLLLDYGDLLVWNPLTGAYKPISHPYAAADLDFNKHEYYFLYGFGYDASTDDYLVLAIHKVKRFPIRYYSHDWIAYTQIFSLKTNSWDQLKGFGFPYRKLRDGTEAGLLLDGGLHWLVSSTSQSRPVEAVIVAFDLVERSLLEIPSPCGLTMQSRMAPGYYILRVIGGCLCLCGHGIFARDVTEIWIMKEYKVRSSWTKLFVLSTSVVPWSIILPICFTNSQGVFGSNCCGGLVKFDSTGVLIEHGTCGNKTLRENLLQSAMYRESLLTLPP